MGKVFIAFGGTETPAQAEIRFILRSGYECWKLEEIPFDDFLQKLKTEIPPRNTNVSEDRYITDMFVKTDIKSIYDKARWGLLLPTPESEFDHHEEETIHLLNLYSPSFLYPFLVATDFGIRDWTYYQRDRFHLEYDQNQSHLFRDPKFVQFHDLLFEAMDIFQWVLDRVQNWGSEEFRVMMGNILFDDLKKYHNSKRPFFGGREYVDQCVILETLLSRKEERTEITYRLKKRIAVALSTIFPDIEKDIKDLYAKRSDYIHGTTFEIIKTSGENFNDLIDFEFAQKCTNYLRVLLAVYSHLHQNRASLGGDTVVDLLERAIIDLPLRSNIEKKANEILSLIPLS